MIMVENKIAEIDGLRLLHRTSARGSRFGGVVGDAVSHFEINQICEVDLWRKFVEQFRTEADARGGWRCEYWGKMMRGSCMIVGYTGDDNMYRILEDSVRDMLTAQQESGKFSTFPEEREFKGWDIWGRKYVLLGMQYFLEICRDGELYDEIIGAMCRHADYILERIGPAEEGKLPITQATSNWQGLNSASILEPYVRLYRLTGEKRYFDFATYIISTGFIENGDLIEIAYENSLMPHEYPVVKAYEMMSCFEGLIQYYYLTGEEKYKTAALNFGYRVVNEEISVIGCCGCTHELFDHTALRETATDYPGARGTPFPGNDGVMQETCVSVTWMKLSAALFELSGDPVFADSIEKTFYNAFLGSLNTHRNLSANLPEKHSLAVMPVDSYSPLTADKRGKYTGGYCAFTDRTFYGCCACISGAGAGLIPEVAVLESACGVAINYYMPGKYAASTPAGARLELETLTEYPYEGRVDISLSLDSPEAFDIAVRIPEWSKNTKLFINGKRAEVNDGYVTVSRMWQSGDRIVLELDMRVRRILPREGAVNSDLLAAYARGPVVLAADMRISDPTAPIDVKCDGEGFAEYKSVICPEIRDAYFCAELPLESGESVRLVDYASAGKTWTNESMCAAWLYRKAPAAAE